MSTVQFDKELNGIYRELCTIPEVGPNTSPLTLFFKSFFYFGRVQSVVNAKVGARNLYTYLEITPFLKNTYAYWAWVALKITVHAVCIFRFRFCYPIYLVSLAFTTQKIFNPYLKIPSVSCLMDTHFGAPEAFRDYLKSAKTSAVLRPYFASLPANAKKDFCNYLASLHPDAVSKILNLDYDDPFFENPFYEQILDTIIKKNRDPFLCFYEVLHDRAFIGAHGKSIFHALISTLSVSTRAEMDSTTFANSNKHVRVNETALELVFRILPHNDRAHAASCCKDWYQISQKSSIARLKQPNVGFKLVWCLKTGLSTHLDTFSKGQIELILKTAHKCRALHEMISRLRLPRKNLGIWKWTYDLALQLDPTLNAQLRKGDASEILQNYFSYLAWQQHRILPQTETETIIKIYFDNLISSRNCDLACDPLTPWILEKGKAEDKNFIYTLLKLVFNPPLDSFWWDCKWRGCLRVFLDHMHTYAMRSNEDFQNIFFKALRCGYYN